MPKLARLPMWDDGRSDAPNPPRPSRAFRYFAFLSYSHRDEKHARWLHDKLERFQVPAQLVGRQTDNGPVPERLTPIFRDRGELSASDDLGAELREAIAASRFLIVLCSPAAAVSRWTNAEIETFKRTHPDGCILAAIVEGEPFASDIAGHENEECLPPALRVRYDRRGRPTGKRAEPLAADLREGRDGKRLGLLKLVAGMLGLGLDDLVQRETMRRQRRLAIVAAASLAGMAMTSTLAVVAIESRDEARDQRREAEGLVGFMLGDLRAKLEPLGRLDVLDSVGGRALEYYRKQDKGSLSDDALAQRSKALTLMGEIAQTRGDLDQALRLYQEAFSGTAEALRRDPDNPQRLFDHAQNVFWVGYIDWQRGQLDRAEAAFRAYKALAKRMIALQPQERKWHLEGVYADTNLGAVLLQVHRYRDAAQAFRESLSPVEALAAAEPRNLDFQKQLSETLAYLSEALEYSGALDEALAQRERQLSLIDRLQRSYAGDIGITAQALPAERAMGRLISFRGNLAEGITHARRAETIADELFQTEPGNTEWMQWAANARLELAELELANDERDSASATTRAGCDIAQRLLERDKSVQAWRLAIQSKCLQLRSRIALLSGSIAEGLELAHRAVSVSRQASNPPDKLAVLAPALIVLGDAYHAANRTELASQAWRQARTLMPTNLELKPSQLAELAQLEQRLGNLQSAQLLQKRLVNMGYRHPDYVRTIRQGVRA